MEESSSTSHDSSCSDYELFPTEIASLYGPNESTKSSNQRQDNTNMLDDMTQLYAETNFNKKKVYCLIMQNNKWKVQWDLFLMALVFFMLIVVPYRMAFTSNDNFTWIMVYSVLDFCFLIDIILSFLTSYTDFETNLEITDHKPIIRKYLRGWFVLDFTSIIPIDVLLSGNNLNMVIRFTKFSKV